MQNRKLAIKKFKSKGLDLVYGRSWTRPVSVGSPCEIKMCRADADFLLTVSRQEWKSAIIQNYTSKNAD